MGWISQFQVLSVIISFILSHSLLGPYASIPSFFVSMILLIWSTNDALDKCLPRIHLFHGNHGHYFFFLSSKPSKRTLQMIFIISSFFGERCKLKTSFVSKSNVMTELMIYHIAQRVPLPEYLLFDCPNSVSVLL